MDFPGEYMCVLVDGRGYACVCMFGVCEKHVHNISMATCV